MSGSPGGIISLNFGGCGLRLGATSTKLIAQDYGIEMDGTIATNRLRQDYFYDVFFSEEKGGSDQNTKSYKARSLFFDSDQDCLDSIISGPCGGLLSPTSNYSSMDGLFSDSTHTYTKGQEYFASSKERFEEIVRYETEKTDKLQGFMSYQSASGGFGSGYSSAALAHLKDAFGKKKSFVGTTILPDVDCDIPGLTATNALIFTSCARRGALDANIVLQNSAIKKVLSK